MNSANDIKLILASTSPRRKDLLHKITDEFIICEPLCDETDDGVPQRVAERNAALKGRSIAGDFVVACDTVVALGNVILGKPHDEIHAEAMLNLLSGKTHTVLSGVYVRYFDKEHIFSDKSEVKIKKLTHSDIIEYIRKYSPFDKAGGYGIQDGVIVESYDGSLDNIIGLPTEKLRNVLRAYIDVKEENNN